jgi:hypothetical protein
MVVLVGASSAPTGLPGPPGKRAGEPALFALGTGATQFPHPESALQWEANGATIGTAAGATDPPLAP